MITMSIDTFFTAIKTGTWHNINDLSTQLSIPTTKLYELTKYLADCGIIEYHENTKTIKLTTIWNMLLPKEEKPQNTKPNIANFVISPHNSIDLQSTHISNLSNIEIEITLRIDKQIKEIAIDISNQ